MAILGIVNPPEPQYILRFIAVAFVSKLYNLGVEIRKTYKPKLAIAVSMAHNSRYSIKKIRTVELKCPYCKRVFDDPVKLRRHRMDKHKMDTASSTHFSSN